MKRYADLPWEVRAVLDRRLRTNGSSDSFRERKAEADAKFFRSMLRRLNAAARNKHHDLDALERLERRLRYLFAVTEYEPQPLDWPRLTVAHGYPWSACLEILEQHEAALRELFTLRRFNKPPPRDQMTIYFVQAVALRSIKIGIAQNVATRLNDIRVGCPDELVVLATIHGVTFAEERRLHERFDATRIRGEWFAPSEELLALIELANIDRERAVEICSFANIDTPIPRTSPRSGTGTSLTLQSTDRTVGITEQRRD